IPEKIGDANEHVWPAFAKRLMIKPILNRVHELSDPIDSSPRTLRKRKVHRPKFAGLLCHVSDAVIRPRRDTDNIIKVLGWYARIFECTQPFSRDDARASAPE